jgi:hypothetical protein
MLFPGPPKGVPAPRLFRELVRRPRPVWPLSLRIPCAPHVRLSARALTAWEDEEARDVEPDLPAEVRLNAIVQRLLVASLLADDRPAFASLDDLGSFDEFEVRAMGAALFDAFAVVMPSYRRIDETMWSKRLEEGAKHPSNVSTVLAIGASSIEAGKSGPLFMPHWDKFFGLPFAEITDGQRMAYAAARKVYEQWCK